METRKSQTKSIRLAEPHLTMLSKLAGVYGTEAAVIRIAIERMYEYAHNLAADLVDAADRERQEMENHGKQ
jgi:hypothetical protein